MHACLLATVHEHSIHRTRGHTLGPHQKQITVATGATLRARCTHYCSAHHLPLVYELVDSPYPRVELTLPQSSPSKAACAASKAPMSMTSHKTAIAHHRDAAAPPGIFIAESLAPLCGKDARQEHLVLVDAALIGIRGVLAELLERVVRGRVSSDSVLLVGGSSAQLLNGVPSHSAVLWCYREYSRQLASRSRQADLQTTAVPQTKFPNKCL